jgi:Spy/CpxP family protein refolding chaperone
MLAVPVLSQETKSFLPSLVAQLNLSGSQKKKLETMYEEQQKKIKSVREDAALADEDKKARLREINAETNKSLSEILTSDQRKKLKELREQNRPKS